MNNNDNNICDVI